jgi:hypothetical protein
MTVGQTPTSTTSGEEFYSAAGGGIFFFSGAALIGSSTPVKKIASNRGKRHEHGRNIPIL